MITPSQCEPFLTIALDESLPTRWFLTKVVLQGTRGSHLYVACASICKQNQEFWPAKSVLDRLIIPLWNSSLDCQWFRSNCSRVFWFLQYRGHLPLSAKGVLARLLDPLINSQRGLWSLDSTWILVTNVSTQDIEVTRHNPNLTSYTLRREGKGLVTLQLMSCHQLLNSAVR